MLTTLTSKTHNLGLKSPLCKVIILSVSLLLDLICVTLTSDGDTKYRMVWKIVCVHVLISVFI